MSKLKKIIKWTFAIIAAILILFLTLVWFITYHPRDIQPEQVVCSDQSPALKPGKKLKVLSWNIQYMAGKNYVFFYDMKDGSGPDDRPSAEDIAITTKEVARIIQEENPDIILLQEVHEGAKRTDYQDQLANLLSLLSKEYSCYASTFYWKASFIPHPHIMGAVGLKLATISKYKINEAIRYQLPLIPANPIFQQFNFKRAVLEVRLPVENAKDLVVLNTHFDAFVPDTVTMEGQVKKVNSILEEITQNGNPWIIGGDYNLVPPGRSYSKLKEEYLSAMPSEHTGDWYGRRFIKRETEIVILYEKYQAVPSLQEVNDPGYEQWFTHFPNDPGIEKPDKTIDYIFMSDNIHLGEHYVRHQNTLTLSDHLPVLVEFEIP
ncbi:MAG: endonuclease/exonuclease/phosphatase family protein [Bacteroidota bacterium]